MSIRIDPFADFVRGTLMRNHRRVGDRHTNEWFEFGEGDARFTQHFCRDFAVQIPRDWRRTTEVIVAPGAAGGKLAVSLGRVIEVPVVLLLNREQNCDPVDQEQAHEMKGKKCLLIDVCTETRATMAGAAATVLQYRGSVIGALVIIVIKSKTNGRGMVHLPLGFEVRGCVERAIDYYTADHCPLCNRKR